MMRTRQASALESPPPWRESALELVLRVASMAAPIGVVIAMLTLHANEQPFDIVIVLLFGVALAVLALRWLTHLPFTLRAGGLITLSLIGSTTVLATTGPTPGATLAAAIAAVLAAILFGTRAMVLVLGLTLGTHLMVGLCIQDGALVLRAADTDPTRFRNWLRTACSTVLLGGTLASVIAYVVRQLETNARVLRTTYGELAELHRRLDLAKEHEERMLSRELEAEVGQSLAALKLRLQRWRAATGSVSTRELDDSLGLVDDLISRTRTLTVGLRPALLDDLGLEPALRAFVEAQAREAGLDASMEASGFDERLPIELETACFRIVEEAVKHAARQADAKHLNVRLRRVGGQLQIRVQDDGDGDSIREPATNDEADHTSFVGIRERVRMLGGELSLSTIDKQPGLRVDVTLPLD